MGEIEAVGVEFGVAGGGDDDAGGVAGLEDVEGEEQGLAEGGCEPVVGAVGEG